MKVTTKNFMIVSNRVSHSFLEKSLKQNLKSVRTNLLSKQFKITNTTLTSKIYLK